MTTHAREALPSPLLFFPFVFFAPAWDPARSGPASSVASSAASVPVRDVLDVLDMLDMLDVLDVWDVWDV